MENCLLTKLNGSVTSNLIKLGYIRVHVDTTGMSFSGHTGRVITLHTTSASKFEVVGTGTVNILDLEQTSYISENVTKGTLNSGWANIEINTGTYDIDIECKYAKAVIFYGTENKSAFSMDIALLNYINTQTQVTGTFKGEYSPQNNTISIIKINQPNLDSGSIHHLTVDVPQVSKCTSLTQLYVKGMLDLEGDITSMCGSMTSLTSLKCSITGLHGDILELASKQVSNGRTSGTITIEAVKSHIKIGGKDFLSFVQSHGGTYYAQLNFKSSGYSVSFS